MTLKELIAAEMQEPAYTPLPSRQVMLADNRAMRIELAKKEQRGASVQVHAKAG